MKIPVRVAMNTFSSKTSMCAPKINLLKWNIKYDNLSDSVD